VTVLQDLDDALCLTFLFASLASSKYVPNSRIESAKRLQREFHAYVAHTCSLRKVFLSIKGIYYQAEVQGCTLTWIEPHAFAQQPTMAVDYRVMLSFLELYESVLTFVNFKLYHDLGLAYPPETDLMLDATGAFLSTMLLKEQDGELPLRTARGRMMPSSQTTASIRVPELSKALVSSLQQTIEGVDVVGTTSAAVAGLTAIATLDEAVEHSVLAQAPPSDAVQLHGLFCGCTVFCGRETPVATLEFLILATGGRVGWEGETSPLSHDDESITHQVIDRPQMLGSPVASREYIQPQWVFDCINARKLLPPQRYRVGVKCPPHLSPFIDGAEGYVPAERVRQALMAHDGHDDCNHHGGDEVSKKINQEEGAQDEQDDGSEGDEGNTEKNVLDEDTTLAIMSMPRKKRRLYDTMQHGIQKKGAAAHILRKKRDQLHSPVHHARAPRLGVIPSN